MVLSDLTVCKAAGSNDAATYDPSLPHVSGGPLPAQFGPTPQTLCELTPIDEDGNPRGPYIAGDVPNIQLPGSAGAVNEGQTVVTNGQNVGGRAGTPSAPGALAPGASTHPVNAGQGLRLQLVSSATTRFFRLRLTTQTGAQIPLVRVGGQGGLLDNARVEGGVVGGASISITTPVKFFSIPAIAPTSSSRFRTTATGVLTLWTEDFQRTGGGFTNTPTVPVAHFEVTGSGTGVHDRRRHAAARGDGQPGRGPRRGDGNTARPERVCVGQARDVQSGHPADRTALESVSASMAYRACTMPRNPTAGPRTPARHGTPRSATRWN